ncbi:MAG: winged helix-turn-helix domain-containing protein [Anaerolineales bacterium]|nr:winged helix-turn-helix domain-containing protein [Anaerolineales bacterium]MBX3037192.1 winged helix-turn-helix domain-containing protein [Anaerolineales bacterium]
MDNQSSPRVFIVCDQNATAPIWGYIVRDKGLIAIVETSIDKAIDNAKKESPDLIVIDLNAPHQKRIEIARAFRSLSASPILFFLPSNNEDEILEAYQNGVDECVVKPISPAIFLAKILAWSNRTHTENTKPRRTKLKLDASHRSATGKNKKEIKLTNLEFQFLQLVMSRPGHVFPNDEIIQRVWGAEGDVVLLKNVVYRLRKKIEEELHETELIQTWPGGYSFVE